MMQRRQGSQLIPPALLCGVERPNAMSSHSTTARFHTAVHAGGPSGATPVEEIGVVP
jgi:hypothetical protein